MVEISEHWDTDMTPQSLREETASRTTDREPETTSDFSTTMVGAMGSQIAFKFIGEVKTLTCDFSRNIPLLCPFSDCHQARDEIKRKMGIQDTKDLTRERGKGTQARW